MFINQEIQHTQPSDAHPLAFIVPSFRWSLARRRISEWFADEVIRVDHDVEELIYLHNACSIAEFRAEKHIRVVEQAIFQTNNNELRPFEAVFE